jgi:hypothetical protein
MTPSLWRALAFFLVAQSLILASGYIMFVMIAEVNRKLPEGQQISYLFGHFAKYSRIFREYRRLYPNSALASCCLVCGALGMLFLLACGWQLGFF